MSDSETANVCGQPHPTAPVTCQQFPGHTDERVVHSARDNSGQLYEWE